MLLSYEHPFKHVTISAVQEDLRAVDRECKGDYFFAEASNPYTLLIDTVEILNHMKEYEVNPNEDVEINDDEIVSFQDWLYNHSGMEQLKADNSYNWSSPISHDLNFEVWGYSEDEPLYVVFRAHRFGDVRGNYTDEFILRFDSYDDFLYSVIYSEYGYMGKNVSVKVDEYLVSIWLEWCRNDYDIYVADEDGNEIETLYDFTLDAENKEQLVAELRDVIKENILD